LCITSIINNVLTPSSTTELLADSTVLLHSMISYRHHPEVCLYLCPSVCKAEHCGSQGGCTGTARHS